MAVDTARIIDGKAVAHRVKAEVAERVRGLASAAWRTPGLATILIGDDPASAVYVAAKRRACPEVGIQSFHHELPGDVTREEVVALIDRLNADTDVSGILCQLPLPPRLDGTEIANRIAPDKDVDGLTVASAGRLALGLPTAPTTASSATSTSTRSRRWWARSRRCPAASAR
jgi:methylenetetrahydrofolate dehydrogenase (NADP+)/methenyltetrahydrofolate cyclohydrolase